MNPSPSFNKQTCNPHPHTLIANIFTRANEAFFCAVQWSVLLPVVLTLIATQSENGVVVDYISDLCYTKWALEAFVISNAKRFVSDFDIPPPHVVIN